MKIVDIRFVKERDSKKLAAQMEMMEHLDKILPERIEEKFSDVQVKIRFSSSSGFDVSGFKGEEREAFMSFLEELWNDPFLLE
ncbi:DNA-damage-inducible protein I [Nicoletella semolina]|uniref:DNA-damage-inducible protein I n=1 Tax=Nicoletella semolina TaxID=271160 RepID=A0A4R2NAY6_9PAST|nr:DinI-like family protein [Nicoletella semolina]MDH2924065.1 DinI family protein [Nicoletella semolina]TCP18200.1 DNA-damage-inducible protein I [Nicoletella semolina]